MNKRYFMIVALVALLAPLPVYSQNETSKGLSGNGLTTLGSVVQESSVYSGTKKTCLALAIGFPGPYKDNAFSRLSFPDDDCRAFFTSINHLFRFQYDIKQFSLISMDKANRTYSAVYDLLDSFRKQPVSKGDVVFIYFSGHGVKYRENYYFPLRDSDAKSHTLMITGSQIYEVAESLANRGANVFIFLDTCASGSIYNAAIELNGPGGVVCFPAASKDLTTQERLTIGSSEFGNMLSRILSGALIDNNSDDLTVSQLINQMSSAMKMIEPKEYNSRYSKVNDAILVSNVKAILEYNKIVSQYESYINAGKNALNDKQYDNALKQFDNASNLSITQNKIAPEDRIDYSTSITELNNQIASSMKNLSSDDDAWTTLASIDVKSPNIDKSIISIAKLMLGCGRYYKNKGDLENAYIFFEQAYKQGDSTYAPFGLYSVTANHNVPAIKPLDEATRQHYLHIAANNGNREASNILNPTPTPHVSSSSWFRRVWDDFTEDDPIVGFSIVSDFNKFPFGLKGDFLWGPFHIGLDASSGSSLLVLSSSYGIHVSASAFVTSNGEPIEPTIEFIGSEDEKTQGICAYTITPGVFYKRISIDCGLGQIWTKSSRTDKYKYTYNSPSSSSSGESGGSSIAISTSGSNSYTESETVVSNNSYFVFKPGLTGIIGDKDEVTLIVSARYRICPKEKILNGFEMSVGVGIHF